jgi:hypothetical protein
MRWAYLGQLREDLGLEVWNFLLIVRTIAQLWISVPTYRNSFNDEVNIREILKLPRAASASSCDNLPFPTSLASSFSANFRPLSIEAWELSIRVTGSLALCATTRAIPRPWTCQFTTF